ADILDADPIQLVEHIEEVFNRSGDPVRSPDQDDIEPAAAAISQHLIEAWPFGLRATDLVGVFVNDLIAALSSPLTQVEKLRLQVLIDGGDSHVKGGALHARLPFLGAAGSFLATYFSMNSRSTSVISRPCAAVVDLKLRGSSVGVLIFKRFFPV